MRGQSHRAAACGPPTLVRRTRLREPCTRENADCIVRSSFRAASHHSPPNPMPRFSIILTVLLALAAPLASSAQSGAPVRAPAGCTYETCALRIEPRFFASARLLRGRTGEPVGSLGGFGSGVDTLLAGPDSAAAHARRYVTDARRAGTLGLIGAVAGIVAIVRANGNHEDDDAVTVGAAIAGVGFSIASIPYALRAAREISRSVWFYNAA